MTRVLSGLMVVIVVVLVVLGDRAISAQDRYTMQVPDGLAFSEFRGYEDWQVIAVSQSGDLLVAILGNPEIIAAYLPAFPATARLSQTVPRWRRSIGTRRRVRRPPLRHWCRTPCMTSISW